MYLTAFFDNQVQNLIAKQSASVALSFLGLNQKQTQPKTKAITAAVVLCLTCSSSSAVSLASIKHPGLSELERFGRGAAIAYSGVAIGVADGKDAEQTFRKAVRESIFSEPVENGQIHSLDSLLIESLSKNSEAANWIQSFIQTESNDSIIADLIRCVGRLNLTLIGPLGFEIARSALRSPSIEIRDAAIQALEAWGGDSLNMLRDYKDRETVPWLREYISQVIRDLEN